MADIFYPKQTNYIQELNNLAGRGAVVAAFSPTAGKSPLGASNGYMDPAWLDPNLPINTNVPLAVKNVGKFGYNFLHGGQSSLFYKLAILPKQNSGSYASLRIDAMLGGWISDTLATVTIVIGNRGGFFVDWTTSINKPSEVKFAAYQETDGSHSIYLIFTNNAFAQASFNLQGMGCLTYSSPVSSNSVTGTSVWDSTANAGSSTYKAPRSTGMSASQGTSFNNIVEVRSQEYSAVAASFLAGGAAAGTPANTLMDVLNFGISGSGGVNYSGCMRWFTSTATDASTTKSGFKASFKAFDTGTNVWTPTLFSIQGNGIVYMPWLKAGTADITARHDIRKTGGQGTEILQVGREGSAQPCVGINGSDGLGGWASSLSVLYVGKNGTTNRGIASPGTFNAQGTDYAEYFVKCHSCAAVIAGQLVGVNNKNQVTDLWADSVMFAIKSTDPSFVGGDSWGSHLGTRPVLLARQEPTRPLRREDVVMKQYISGTNPPEFEDVIAEPGETDDEWESKIADYSTAVAQWEQSVETDRLVQVDFDAKLEEARARVDRIAIAGRVPVNVLGAQPGDYIVPVQDGEGIKGIAVNEDNMTLKQYLRAVGQVITIEEDGRAYVMVKSV